MPTKTELKLEAPADEPVILFERFFAAPPQLLYRMFTEPEHLRRWWGPRALVIEVCEVDLRLGGSWRITQRDPEGTEHGFHGRILELDPPQRIVRTFVYEGTPDEAAIETSVLEAVLGGTLVHGSLLCSSIAVRDFHVEAGMEQGMAETLTRLDELLTRDELLTESG